MELTWKNMKKIMAIVAFGIILYMVLQNKNEIFGGIQSFMDVLTPFILGACIAFVVNIPMKFLEKKNIGLGKKKQRKVVTTKKESPNKVRRFLSILLSVLFIFVILILVLSLLLPELANVIKSFVTYLSGLPEQIMPFLNKLVTDYPELAEEVSKLQLDFSNILNSFIDFFKNAGAGVAMWVVNTLSSTVSGIVNLVIGIIFAFYILLSKEKIGRAFKRITLAYLPEKIAYKLIEIVNISREAFSKFITGQLKEAVILGVLCYIGMLILGLPFSLTISLLTIITALVPIFGAFIGASVGVILLLSISPIKALTFLIFIVVLQQIETNLIYPHVVGDSVGLPGIIVLVAITIGGNLAGVLGMLVSLPLASVVYTLLKASVKKRLQKKQLEE